MRYLLPLPTRHAANGGSAKRPLPCTGFWMSTIEVRTPHPANVTGVAGACLPGIVAELRNQNGKQAGANRGARRPTKGQLMKIEFKNLRWVAVACVGGFAVHAVWFAPATGKHRAARLSETRNVVSMSSPAPPPAPGVFTNFSLHWEQSAPTQRLWRVTTPWRATEQLEVLPGVRQQMPGAPPGHSTDLFDLRQGE